MATAGDATVSAMLAIPCGLPTYVGAWPPLVAGAAMIQPLALLAASTPHSACACGGGTEYRRSIAPAPEPPADS
jgi:hypothetical protein